MTEKFVYSLLSLELWSVCMLCLINTQFGMANGNRETARTWHLDLDVEEKIKRSKLSRISARSIYMWHAGQERPYPHCGPDLSVFCMCPNKHNWQHSQNMLFRVGRPCVQWLCWCVLESICTGFCTKQIICKADMQNKMNGKGSICVCKGSWKVFFSE